MDQLEENLQCLNFIKQKKAVGLSKRLQGFYLAGKMQMLAKLFRFLFGKGFSKKSCIFLFSLQLRLTLCWFVT